MRRIPPLLRASLILGLVVMAWWWSGTRRSDRPTHASSAAAVSHVARGTGQGSAAPSAPLVSSVAPASTALAALAYARTWSAEGLPALAAFQEWTRRFLAAGPGQRTALEPEGVALARTRRAAFRALIERDPRAALAATVPMAVRAQLPALVVAELESRFSAVGDFTVLAFDYGPKELIRRKQAGLDTHPFRQTVQWPGGAEYRAYIYGRREGQTTKHGIPLHGVFLDGVAALHESPVRALEADEVPPATQSLVAVAATGDVVVEIGGKLYRFASPDDALRAAEKLAAVEAGIGPQEIPPIDQVVFNVTPATKSPGLATSSVNQPLAATPWTVGAKKILVIRVDFSDLPGEPKSANGVTTYTAAYVQNLADVQVAPYYVQSSFGAVPSLTTTVSSQVYRMPQTASTYAVGDLNTQLHTDARTAASAHYTLATYDRLVVLFSNLGALPGSQITYGGLASVGGPSAWVNGEWDFRVAAHELGHTWGLRHANLWKVTDGNPVSTAASAASVEYGDDFDTMGANFANDTRTDFNPWFKNLLGWVNDSQVQTITSTGTYRVNRFDNATGTGTLALRVARDGTRSYWIGPRRNFTNNASMAHGAYVVWGYNNNTQSNLLDLTTPGTSVADAALAVNATLLDTAGNVSIKPVAEGGTAPNEYLDVLVTIGLNGMPVIAAHPVSQGFAVGGNVTLSVTATGTPTPAYQWRKYGSDISGATNATYTIANAQAYHAGTYTVQLSNTVATIVSDPVALSLNALPFISSQPANLTMTAGLTATFSVGVTGFPSPISYQWRKAGTPISGATTATYSLPNVQTTSAGNYDVVITNSVGSTTSATASLAVNTASSPPSNDNFASAWSLAGNTGLALATNVGATGESGEPTHISSGGTASAGWFRWTPTVSGTARIDTIGSPFDTVLAVYTGSSVAALTMVRQDDDGGDAAGGGPSLVTFPVTAGTTYAIAVGSYDPDVRGPITLNYSAVAPPTIATQPAAVASTVGSTATFTVAASGLGLTYEWFRNNVVIPGATFATFALGNLTLADAGSYRVDVANLGGTMSSNTVTLAANAATPPVITTQPVAQIVAGGGAFTLSVAATGSAPLSYQWSRNGASLAGATNASLSVSNAQWANAGRYSVTVSNAGGAATSATVDVSLTGMLWAMGSDSSGELGVGTVNWFDVPVAIASRVKAMSAGRYHSMFLTTDGTLWAMGENRYAQLGDGTTIQRESPVAVAVGVKAVSAGVYHSLYLKNDGTLWAFGDNSYGSWGDGPSLQIAAGVSAIAAGLYHSLFLKIDGTLWAVGQNNFGQLGVATGAAHRCRWPRGWPQSPQAGLTLCM